MKRYILGALDSGQAEIQIGPCTRIISASPPTADVKHDFMQYFGTVFKFHDHSLI